MMETFSVINYDCLSLQKTLCQNTSTPAAVYYIFISSNDMYILDCIQCFKIKNKPLDSLTFDASAIFVIYWISLNSGRADFTKM